MIFFFLWCWHGWFQAFWSTYYYSDYSIYTHKCLYALIQCLLCEVSLVFLLVTISGGLQELQHEMSCGHIYEVLFSVTCSLTCFDFSPVLLTVRLHRLKNTCWAAVSLYVMHICTNVCFWHLWAVCRWGWESLTCAWIQRASIPNIIQSGHVGLRGGCGCEADKELKVTCSLKLFDWSVRVEPWSLQAHLCSGYMCFLVFMVSLRVLGPFSSQMNWMLRLLHQTVWTIRKTAKTKKFEFDWWHYFSSSMFGSFCLHLLCSQSGGFSRLESLIVTIEITIATTQCVNSVSE